MLLMFVIDPLIVKAIIPPRVQNDVSVKQNFRKREVFSFIMIHCMVNWKFCGEILISLKI